MEIAKTILSQLGGNKFIAMTGSKNLGAGENYLSMHLTRNAAKAKYLKITLDPSDTYTMEFYSMKTKTFEKVTKAKFEGVYCDQLQSIFTEVTGLYTSL